jgi:hypothetical protein
MGRARILITPHLLRQWLPFPASADIIGSRECCGYVEIVVESPDLPDGEGEMPLAEPTFRKVEPVVFVDWGVR